MTGHHIIYTISARDTIVLSVGRRRMISLWGLLNAGYDPLRRGTQSCHADRPPETLISSSVGRPSTMRNERNSAGPGREVETIT